MGSATARAPARAGHDVVLYEQFEVGHARGSSHGRSRIVRLAYPELEFVELAQEAFPEWRAVAHGARLEERTRIDALDDLDAAAVVVTAGSWVTRLVPGLPVQTTRETVAYFRRGGDPLPSVVQL